MVRVRQTDIQTETDRHSDWNRQRQRRHSDWDRQTETKRHSEWDRDWDRETFRLRQRLWQTDWDRERHSEQDRDRDWDRHSDWDREAFSLRQTFRLRQRGIQSETNIQIETERHSDWDRQRLWQKETEADSTLRHRQNAFLIRRHVNLGHSAEKQNKNLLTTALYSRTTRGKAMLLLFGVFCLGTLQSTKSSKHWTGFKPGTFWSRVWRSNHWAIPTPPHIFNQSGRCTGGGGGGGVSGVGGGKTLNLLFGTVCIYTVWGQPPELGGGWVGG